MIFPRPHNSVIPVFLWVASFLISGCGGAINKGKNLKKDSLNLFYSSINRVSRDIDNMPLQHPAHIPQNIIEIHPLSLQYGKINSQSRRKSIFRPDDAGKISRLLSKALNRARRDRYFHFEFDAARGRTTGEVFISNNKIHWVFTAINGVHCSNDPLGICKKTWKMVPLKGQQYYLMETSFGKKIRQNWIVADIHLSKPNRYSSKTAHTKLFPGEKTEETEKRKLLNFLKRLHDKKLIDKEEYEQEKRAEEKNEKLTILLAI